MGAWGAKSFDNDDAMDWVAEIEGAITLDSIKDVITIITKSDGEYVEAPECSMALAAAEVLAALLKRPAPDLPEEIKEWVQSYSGAISDGLISLALKAIAQIKGDSELKDLWEEAGATEWYAEVNDLERRLQP
jgi:Domain of unknown function (DUF4259)